MTTSEDFRGVLQNSCDGEINVNNVEYRNGPAWNTERCLGVDSRPKNADDHYEGDGQRVILARQNEPAQVRVAPLSQREQQVVAMAALGRSNKEIAYELGISHATVRVLSARAARKLGVRNRRQLLERVSPAEPVRAG